MQPPDIWDVSGVLRLCFFLVGLLWNVNLAFPCHLDFAGSRAGAYNPGTPVRTASDQRRSAAIPAARAPRTPRARRPEAALARPFIKWAGGKQQLAAELVARAPRAIETYYEPFIGGGAMFFALLADPALAQKRAVLNDLNRDLITVYEIVRDEVDALVAHLEALQGPYLAAGADERSTQFYAERGRQPEGAVDLAARFIFLNKTCFNGLYRVNRQGIFNVPHGKYRQPRILDEPNLRAASAALAGVRLTHVDFESALAAPKQGDFVYLDPPFEPLSATSSFTGYTEGSFSRTEQRRLKLAADDLTDRGVHVMLSNSAQDYIRGLYSATRGPFAEGRYRIDSTPARRAINSRGDKRGPVDELVVLNYAPGVERRELPSN